MNPKALTLSAVCASSLMMAAWAPAQFPGLPKPNRDLLAEVPLAQFECTGAKAESVDLSDAPGGKIVRVETGEKKKNTWDAQLRWIPKAGTEAGATLVWVFWARISPEDKENSTCEIIARLQKNSPDWATYFNQAPVLEKKWKRFAFAFSPKSSIGASDSKLSYLLGARKAVLEFADVSLVDLGTAVTASDAQGILDKAPVPSVTAAPSPAPTKPAKTDALPRKIPGPAIKEIPVISSGFDGDVEVVIDPSPHATLKGADPKFPIPNSWNNLGEGLNFDFLIKGYAGRSAFEIVPDPVRVGNRVLKIQVKDKGDSGINGRAQGTFYPNGRHDLQHFRFKQFISKDYQLLADIPEKSSPQWTDFFEIWSPACGREEESWNGAGAFRVCYDFEPDREGGFKWHLTGHNMSGMKSELYKGWNVYSTVPVPFGKWCEWDVLIVKGPDPKVDPASRAQVLVKMRPEGHKEWTTLFDVRDERTEHSRIKQKGWYQVAPFKNYMGPKTVEWLLSKGATDISFLFDDFSYAVGDAE